MNKTAFLLVLLVLISSCVKVYYGSESKKLEQAQKIIEDAKKTDEIRLGNITRALTNKSCKFYECETIGAQIEGICILSREFRQKYNMEYTKVNCFDVKDCYNILRAFHNVAEEDLQDVKCTMSEADQPKPVCEWKDYGIPCLNIDDCFDWIKNSLMKRNSGATEADIQDAIKEYNFKCA